MAGLTKGPVTIHEFEELDLSSAMMIECFPTIGLVSTIAASYLVSQMKLELKGTITAPWLPPVAVVYGGRAQPPVRIYGGEKVCGIDGNCDQMFLIMSEFPIPDNGVYPMADALLDWTAQHGCREIVSLEGLPKEGPSKDTEPEKAVFKPSMEVWGVGATERARAMLKREKVPEMDAGVITGISGVLLWLAEQRKVDALCLLAEAYKDFPDARAAAGLVRVIDALLQQLEVKLEPLLKQAEELERQIKHAVESALEAAQSRSAPAPSGPSTGMYY